MLETEIIRLREAVEALTQALAAQCQKPPAKRELPTAAANETAPDKTPESPAPTPDKTPESPAPTPDKTPETIPTNAELQTMCACLVRKNPEWREVIKEHLTARNAVKVADLNDTDKVWFAGWMTKELA